MTRELLLVVGAGASKEVGLPIGDELKKIIAGLLEFKFGMPGQLSSGDNLLYLAIREVAKVRGNGWEQLKRAARQIANAIPQAISIDNFIDAHAGNAEIELVGKLAIVRSILNAERKSKLYFDPNSNTKNRMPFPGLEDVWLTKFFRLLTENCRAGDLPERMKAITMIVFNYDRCIEHFLFHALRNYYDLSEAKACDLIRLMTIYHPYGKVGNLPWENMRNGVEFGGEPSPSDLMSLAKDIKTFTEGTDPESSEIINIKKRVIETKTALFMGFAYHRLNLELISSPRDAVETDYSKRYYATAFGMSDSDTALVRNDLARLGTTDRDYIQVRNDLECYKLFHEFGRSISLV